MTPLAIVPPAPRPLPAQFADVAVLTEDGHLWVPDEAPGDGAEGWPLFAGIRVRWLPADRPDGAFIQFLGGASRTDEDRRDFLEEGFVTSFMRPDLRHLIEQLQAIDAQLEGPTTW